MTTIPDGDGVNPNGNAGEGVQAGAPSPPVAAAIPSTEAPVRKLLTPDEQKQLDICEGMIKQGLETFLEVGIALSTIRDRRLYRVDFETFEDYVEAKWAMSRRQADRLCQGAQIAQSIANQENFETHGSQSVSNGQSLPGLETQPGPSDPAGIWLMPANERQTRALVGLPPEEMRAAWLEAVNSAPNGRVTGAHVARVVKVRRIRLGLEVPTAQSGPAAQPASKRPLQEELVGIREERLRAVADGAIAKVRELQDLLGTPDSAEVAELGRALETLQTVKDHLESVRRMHANRPNGATKGKL